MARGSEVRKGPLYWPRSRAEYLTPVDQFGPSRHAYGRVHQAESVGRVLALEDVAGGKVCALASRVEARDYADTARMLDRYGPAQLISFAHRLDPGLTAQDFADAGRQLDRVADEEFVRYGLSQHDITEVRAKFAVWPRTPQAIGWEAGASEVRHPGSAPEHRSTPSRDDPGLG